MTEPKKKSRTMNRLESLLAKREEEEKAVKEGRWHDIEDEETDEERENRIMGNRSAWQ